MKTLLVLGLVLVFSTTCVLSASRPSEGTPDCNASADHWGCPREDWLLNRNGRPDRLRCTTTPEPIMSWATKVTHTDKYKTWAGPENRPSTRYIPGTVMDINIRVMSYKAKYRGILMYAEANNGQRVGEWLLPEEDTPFFKLPWPNDHPTCRQSLMHDSAELKPLKSTIKWKAPPAGTGTVTFHCLIKSGDANTGDFWWPNQAPLQLRERRSAVPPPQTWFPSKLGQNCNQRCAEENLLCDRVSLESINSPDRIRQFILPQGFPCKLPFVSGCSPRGPTMGKDGLCYYDDTRCRAQRRTVADVTCGSRSVDPAVGIRMCKCVETTQAPVEPEQTDLSARAAAGVSPASKPVASFLFMALAILGLSMKTSQHKMTTSVLMILCLVALIAFPSVQAHNWMRMPARSENVASTQTPCPSRVHGSPHIQVGPGQKYQIEWASGHSRSSYYVWIHARDEDKLKKVTFELMRDYFDNCPSSGKKTYKTWHRRYRTNTNAAAHEYLYEREVPATNLPRPEAFGFWPDNGKLFEYKEEFYRDNYCEYASTKYPFIKAVLIFGHFVHRPLDGDVVELPMPGDEYGPYVIQWLWNGYRDCIDVDYSPNQIENIYGLPNPDSAYTRIDHCYFPNYLDVHACFRIYNDMSICEARCNSIGRCNGFYVMPRESAKTMYDEEANLLPQQCLNNVPTNTLEVDPKEVHVCILVRARVGSETFGPTEVVQPGDPAYSSTCYQKGAGNVFQDIVPPPQHQDIPWRHGDRCISCDAVNLNKNATRVPTWPLTDDCRNCDLEPKTDTPPFNPPRLLLKETHKVCDGHDAKWVNRGRGARYHECSEQDTRECTKKLFVRGRPAPYNERFYGNDCAAAALLDPECSNTVYTQSAGTTGGTPYTRCFCYTKVACCKECNPRDFNNAERWNIWTVEASN